MMFTSMFMSTRQQLNRGNGRAKHPATTQTDMKHADFLQQHVNGHQDALRTLNITMYHRPDREYHWFANFPYVNVSSKNLEQSKLCINVQKTIDTQLALF